MSEDAIIFRRQIADEIHELDNRRNELLKRMREIDGAIAEDRVKADLAAGRTNSCGHPWREDETCSYCGSMNVARAIELLKTQGTSYSGADWKYGWPHKFYIGDRKFYNIHLKDASPDQFAEFAKLSIELFGVTWDLTEGKLRYAAPLHGVQKWGVVGVKGE